MRITARDDLRSVLSTSEEQMLRITLAAVQTLLAEITRTSRLYQKAPGKMAYLQQAGTTLQRRLCAILAEHEKLQASCGWKGGTDNG